MSREQINEAKRTLPLPELMTRLGFGDRAKRNARCPFHSPDKHPSFSVWQASDGAWFWKCHAGCGQGDEIDFLAEARGISSSDATKLYLDIAGVPSNGTGKTSSSNGHTSGDTASNDGTSDEQAIAALATLSTSDYERQRKEQARGLGIRATVLDKLVASKRTQSNSSLQGSAVVLPSIEP